MQPIILFILIFTANCVCDDQNTFSENNSFSSRASTIGIDDDDRRDFEVPFEPRDSADNGCFKPCSFSENYRWRDYPFSQRSDHESDTLRLNKQIDTVEALQLSSIWDDVNKYPIANLRHFIFEDGVRLDQLKGMQGEYGFHFHGKPSDDLGGLKKVLGQGFKLKHIDIAYRTPDEATRDAIFNVMLEILDHPSVENIETISFRFFGLSDQQLIAFGDKLMGKPRKLQRLILSFNAITDAVLTQGGVVERFIKDVRNLPDLKGIDLKGNALIQPDMWDLTSAFTKRRLAHRRSGGFRGYFRLGLNNLPSDINKRTPFADETIVSYQPMASASVVNDIKLLMANS